MTNEPKSASGRDEKLRVVALSGGVGGARLISGLATICDIELSVIVNTADDLTHWGLRICPDLDTNMYTLAGLAPRERGWGIEGDTFRTLEEMQTRGGDEWFALGDRDLATHILRTAKLQAGETLTEITGDLCRRLGVTTTLLPMSNEPAPTTIHTQKGAMPLQAWLVQERATPTVQRIEYTATHTTPRVREALANADLCIIAPSNPYVSIEPILTLPGIRDAVATVPTIGVSPLIGAKAVKGPLATMVQQLAGTPASPAAVARIYDDILNAWVVAPGDGDAVSSANLDHLEIIESPIFLLEDADRVRVAELLVSWGATHTERL